MALSTKKEGGAMSLTATKFNTRSRRRRFIALFVLACALGLSGTALVAMGSRSAASNPLITHTVHFGRLPMPIVVRGDVEPAESSDIVCRVKALTQNGAFSTTITSIVEDGAMVRR